MVNKKVLKLILLKNFLFFAVFTASFFGILYYIPILSSIHITLYAISVIIIIALFTILTILSQIENLPYKFLILWIYLITIGTGSILYMTVDVPLLFAVFYSIIAVPFIFYILLTMEDIRHENFYLKILKSEDLTKEKVSRLSGWYLKLSAFIIFLLLSSPKEVPSRALYFLKKEDMRHSAEAEINKSEVMIRINGRQERIEDPFDIPLEWADKISDEDMISLYELIKKQRGPFLDQKFKEYKATALALSGEEVVHFNKVPSPRDIKEIKNRTKKICYIFLRTETEEVSVWSPTTLSSPWDDHYPTIPLYLGNPTWPDQEVFTKGTKIDADFDTGNAGEGLNVFEVEIEHSLSPLELVPLPEGAAVHVGKPFSGYLSEVKIGVKDFRGGYSVIIMTVVLVKNWYGSSFVEFNRNRKGFVGRELMFRFGLRLELDTKNKRTSVLSLG